METVTPSVSVTKNFVLLLEKLTSLCKQHYVKRLVSLAVFGSVGRGVPRPDSDIDLLLVIRDLPSGRLQRAAEFHSIETGLAPAFAQLAKTGLHVELSPVFKTPEEVQSGSPLFLDMVDDARILVDQDDFLKQALQNLKDRLEKLGARRIWQGDAWYWDLKPDYQPGEVFEI